MNKRILIIDTDHSYLRLLSTALGKNGYDVLCADDYNNGYAQFFSLAPNLLIIDASSVRGEAVKTLKLIREYSSLPIIALCSYDTERAVLELLNAGADIFLPKPISTARLIAYIKVCFRRADEFLALSGSKIQSFYKFKRLSVNIDTREVLRDGKSIHLTKNEFKILALFCRHSGKVLNYDFIIKQIWGAQVDGYNSVLRVNITNIRHKIEPDAKNPIYIFTENGVGYRMCEALDDSGIATSY